MNRKTLKSPNYITRIKSILKFARAQSLRAVDSTMVAAYWHIGQEIVEEEQRGQRRAEYGKAVIASVARELQSDFGKGFSQSHIRNIRQFYLVYSDCRPVNRYTPSSESNRAEPLRSQLAKNTNKNEICYTSCSKSGYLNPDLSWSHYRLLMRVSRVEARAFYEAECLKAKWSVRELERQICSLLFDRLAKSRDKKGLMALANKGHEVFKPSDLIKDPYILLVFEFYVFGTTLTTSSIS